MEGEVALGKQGRRGRAALAFYGLQDLGGAGGSGEAGTRTSAFSSTLPTSLVPGTGKGGRRRDLGQEVGRGMKRGGVPSSSPDSKEGRKAEWRLIRSQDRILKGGGMEGEMFLSYWAGRGSCPARFSRILAC